MIGEQRAFFAIDRGLATIAAALIAPVGGRRRLLASRVAPASVATDAVLARLVAAARTADRDLAADLIPDDPVVALERIEVRSRPAGTLAVLTATGRGQAQLGPIVSRTGWRGRSATIESHDPREMTALALDPDVSALLAAADQRAGADERGGLADIGALVAAVAARRPELPIVLSGSMADQEPRIREFAPDHADLVLAPDAAAGDPPGERLREILVSLRRAPDDPRSALVRGAERLAVVLDRRVELLDVGVGGGLRVVAEPPLAGGGRRSRSIAAATAGLVPDDLDDAAIDRIAAWLPIAVDRHRMRDRLLELRSWPWADSAGDGARIRMAATRAALSRLVELSPELSAGPVPDLVVVAGAVGIAPAPAIALAVADVLRRPAAIQLALDHARLLAPIGAIAADADALGLTADLADDLLAPLAGIVMPGGVRAGRPAGSVVVRNGHEQSELDLVGGGVELVDLPPGVQATAEFAFRHPVTLGGRGRHFAVEVAGGLGGLLVDLRDIPLRLPERADERRAVLGGWQDALWAGQDG